MNVLKVWGLSLHGNGQLKYAYEIMYLVHNLTYIWPPSIMYVLPSLFIALHGSIAQTFSAILCSTTGSSI